MLSSKKYFEKYSDILLSKILIIEDDRMQRLFLKAIFEKMGFCHIQEAVNGEEGWEKTLDLDPDLVILDVNMPVMDGIEYCKKARAHKDYNDMTILVQTGISDYKEKAKVFDAGATDYVIKPVDPNEISARSMIHLRNSHNLKELSEFNERVKIEMASAKSLIEDSLPKENTIKKLKKEYNIDLAASFESSNELGGDFWGCYPISDSQVAIYTIDISGHGLDSALNALRIHSLLLASERILSPGDFLVWLNNKLEGLFPVGLYSTMFFGIIDVNKDTLTYATSATPSPIIFRKNKETHEEISGKGYPLGVLKNATFATEEIPFAAGDTLILYSDAITEALDKKGNIFGINNFVEIIKKGRSKTGKTFSSKKLLGCVLQSFHAECGNKLADDLTLNIYHRSK